MVNPAPVKVADDSTDFAELLAGHQSRLLGYIRSLIPDRDGARDILQETNMILLRKARDFEPGTNFTAWAFRVAHFEVLTWRRRKGRDRLHFDDDLVEQLARTAEKESALHLDRLDALKSCVRKLPERQREVIERRYLEAESVGDIADAIGSNANAVSQTLFRARSNLLECVQRQMKTAEVPFQS